MTEKDLEPAQFQRLALHLARVPYEDGMTHPLDRPLSTWFEADREFRVLIVVHLLGALQSDPESLATMIKCLGRLRMSLAEPLAETVLSERRNPNVCVRDAVVQFVDGLGLARFADRVVWGEEPDKVVAEYAEDVWKALKATQTTSVGSQTPNAQRDLYGKLLYNQLRVLASTGLRLRTFFEGAGYLTKNLWSVLPFEEFAEVIEAPIPHCLCIGGAVLLDSDELVLIRGDFDVQVSPLSQFRATGAETTPNFTDFAVIDWGQAVRFGKYEAALDAIT